MCWARRYESAGELARDLRHYLADEPIEAKRDSAWYVLRKSFRRHRIPVAVAGLFLALLAGSTVVMSVLSIRASRSEREAIHNLHDSLVVQARAIRRSGRTGQRYEALKALTRAAQIDPTLEVRNEAIAALAMADLKPLRRIERGGATCFDVDRNRCAVSNPDGGVSMVRFDDGVETCRVPPPTAGINEIFRLALRGSIFVRLFDPPAGLRRIEVWRIGEAKPALELDDVPFRARFDISPDGRRLAIGRIDHAIHIYDLETMRVVQRIGLDRDPSYLTFDTTGHRLVLYHGNFESARLLNLDSGKQEPIFDSPNISWSVAWQPNGSLVAGAAFNGVEVWDAASRRRVALLAGHEAQIVHLAFSHDGCLLLSYGWDGQSVLWDVRTQRVLLRINLAFPEFGSDDRLLMGLVGAGKGLAIDFLHFENRAPRQCLVPADFAEATNYAGGAFEPRSGLLLMSNVLDNRAVTRIYEPWSGHELVCETLNDVYPTALDSGGRFLIGSTKSGLFRWPLKVEPGHIEIGEPVLVCSERAVDTIQLSADGATALSGDNIVGDFQVLHLGDPAAGRVPAGSAPGRLIKCGRRAGGTRLSPDGRWVAIGIWYASSAEVWDARTGRRVTTLQLPGNSNVEFSTDGTMLATNDDQGLALWRTESWELLRRSPVQGSLRGFSPDGRFLVISTAPTSLRLIDTATLKEVATLEPPESYSTKSIAFSPEGSLLAQFTNRNGVVHLWDLRILRMELAAMGRDRSFPPFAKATSEPTVDWRVSSKH
jgi:WD40 repeat protein